MGANDGKKSSRRSRVTEAAARILSPSGAGKGGGAMHQLYEIPFDAEVFLEAKAARARSLGDESESDEIVAETVDYGNVPTVHAHLKGLDKVCRGAEWSKPLQRFLTRLQLGSNKVNVVYDSNLRKMGIEPPEETESWVDQSEPSKFAGHIYRFVGRQCRSASSDRHLYILYHPDAEWHADFYELLQDKPLPSNFLGFSDNLDALVAYIRFIRKRLGRRASSAMFHILIPSSRPIAIRNALEFPDLGDLAIHGETHNGSNYVWMNLPSYDEYPSTLHLRHVENAIREDSPWKTSATVSTSFVGLTASLAGAAYTLRVKGAPFPSLKTFGAAAVATTIARRVKGADYYPLAVLGAGSLCTTLAAFAINRVLSKRAPRVIGGTDTPREPREEKEKEKEDSAGSDQEDAKEEEEAVPEPEIPAPAEEPAPKIKDDSDAQSFLSQTSNTKKSSSSKKHRRSERSEREKGERSERKRSHK
ncbi:hypothetical protein FGSG_02335 [Fusarium graminearum PH-1]|uniref:Chromosome 1, complete genome n=1 Tax=Gibberella zeae (strain ATCC MYA-4620 / CBS 123657 / FGSC 9075 / NRRL 31084 / PH-1) TaxID=229533 RepID=I1RF69_GIBZE|nr:hypothetical protein FGSG_02335 [Fusarium graminearum PH-1]ESU07759.1 hypothetical protein FGSG_02335 [Fusarium graminearum PH-1]EYB31000.1 hypothetical protein FG05_02335 [Fusarium graminearum]CEF74612.1 unnamed protein product [Fusarium graminearum]|eukprot:XP_011318244.1 hypothetical protein FGSG_02335 [Fusarium graminearum PH-1]